MRDDGTLENYLDSLSNYGTVPFKVFKDPSYGWAMPYVTGHRYRLHWGRGLDFTTMTMDPSINWAETDKDVRMVFNFTETREAINVTSSSGQVDNNTLTTIDEADWQTGDYQMRNDTNNGTVNKEFEIVFNCKRSKRQNVRGYECILGKCPVEKIEKAEIDETPRMWSNKDSWGGTLPVDGDEVVIEPSWWVELYLAETPKLKSLTIHGRLSFKDDPTNLPSIKLQSHWIYVTVGELIIGSEEKPFLQNAQIKLLGLTDSDTLTLDGSIKAGNKVLATSGKVAMFGKQRHSMSRLEETVKTGDTIIKVAADTDWAVGEEIFLATSTIQHHYGEYRKIAAIDAGVITLDEALKNYHYG